MRIILHIFGGRATWRPGATTSPVYNPRTGQVQATVEHGDAALLAEAVTVAKAAQPAWAAVNPQRRARVSPGARPLRSLATWRQDLTLRPVTPISSRWDAGHLPPDGRDPEAGLATHARI
jgi:hypothetical protein